MESTSADGLVVLGVDPGISVTGYGVVAFQNGRGRAVTFGAIKLRRGSSEGEKLMTLHRELESVINQWCPSAVAIEDFVVGHVRAAVVMGEARAMALLAAAQAGLPATLYKPAEVKQAVTTYGRGSKEQVAEMVKALVGVKELPKPLDVTDSLAVALCHCLRQGGPVLAR